jgi:serine/threonine protein kinase
MSAAPVMTPTKSKPTTEWLLLTCGACQHEFRVPAQLQGRKIPCPHCRKSIQVAAIEASKPADKLVGREIGGVRLLKRLGAGALGVVYAGEQIGMKRKVAVKLLSAKAAADPEVVARFEREAKLCAQIRHDGVVAVFNCGTEHNVHYLVMELVQGGTLATVIEEQGRLPWKTACQYILQVADGLKYCHNQSIIHRDIKPANILVETGAKAKLADLGLGKQLDSDVSSSTNGLTMQGVAMGSPAYMPPEQIRSAKDATPVSDLYALGATLYQCLTGALPFDGRSAGEVMGKVLREQPPAIELLAPDVPPSVRAFTMRCIEKEPSRRPQSAEVFIKELTKAMENPQAGGGGVWGWITKFFRR